MRKQTPPPEDTFHKRDADYEGEIIIMCVDCGELLPIGDTLMAPYSRDRGRRARFVCRTCWDVDQLDEELRGAQMFLCMLHGEPPMTDVSDDVPT